MKKNTLTKHLTTLVRITDELLQKALKRGDIGAASRLIREQRHNLKALRK